MEEWTAQESEGVVVSPWMVSKCNKVCFCIGTYQRESSAENALKSLVDKMTCFVNITQPFPPDTFVVTMAEMNALHRLNEHDLSFTSLYLAITTAECPKIPSVKSTTDFLIGHNSLGKLANNLWQITSLKPFNLRRQHVVIIFCSPLFDYARDPFLYMFLHLLLVPIIQILHFLIK